MDNFKEHKVNIQAYDGNLKLISKLKSLISEKYAELFYAVIVHGSVATNEVIPYSDFDGLIIVKDDFVNSIQLQKFKRDSMNLILNFDPLQHHGWFQIKESDLKNYPESYLPTAVLEYSKVVYPIGQNIDFMFLKSETVDYKSALIGMMNQFETRLNNQWRPRNMYELKSMLSQIMLIPSMYYSAVYHKGIFKANSFDAVKPEFTEEEWMPIKVSTFIRENWSVDVNAFQKLVLKINIPIFQKLRKKFFMPSIDKQTQNLLDNDFYHNLRQLIKKVKTKVK